MSLLLVGDNSQVQILRILTSIELFVNATFYSHRLSFLSPVDKHAEYFSNINKLLPMSVSQQSIDTGYIYICIYTCNRKMQQKLHSLVTT